MMNLLSMLISNQFENSRTQLKYSMGQTFNICSAAAIIVESIFHSMLPN